jgi:hypothetical protein
VLGFFLPLIWLVLSNVHLVDALFKEMSISETMISKPYFSLLTHLLILFLFLISLRYIFERFGKSSIRFKRLFRIVLFLLIYPIACGTILYYFLKTDYFLSLGLVFLPILLAYLYLDAKVKTLATILFYTLIVLNIVKFII